MKRRNIKKTIHFLLISFFFLSLVSPLIQVSFGALIFSNDFENGNFDFWDGVTGNVEISETQVYEGNYSAELNTSYMESAELGKTLGYGYLTVTAYHQVMFTAVADGDSNSRAKLTDFVSINSKIMSELFIWNTSGTMNFTVKVYCAFSVVEQDWYDEVELDKWYNMTEQIHIDDDEGHYLCYLNGTIALNVSDINNSHHNYVNQYSIVQNREGSYGGAITRYVDDVIIGESLSDIAPTFYPSEGYFGDCYWNNMENTSQWTTEGGISLEVEYTDYEEGNGSMHLLETDQGTTRYFYRNSVFNASACPVFACWFKLVFTWDTDNQIYITFREDANNYFGIRTSTSGSTLWDIVTMENGNFHYAQHSGIYQDAWYWLEFQKGGGGSDYEMSITKEDGTVIFESGGFGDSYAEVHPVSFRATLFSDTGQSEYCEMYLDYVRQYGDFEFPPPSVAYGSYFPEEEEDVFESSEAFAEVIFGHVPIYLGLIGLIMLVLSIYMGISKTQSDGLGSGFVWFWMLFMVGLGLFIGYLFG